MPRRVAVDGDRVVLVQGSSPAVHGATAWDFPEGPEGVPLAVWPKRGDVLREDVVLHHGAIDGPRVNGTEWSIDALREAWSAGTIVLAPWVPPHVFGRPTFDVPAWEVAPAIRMLPVRTPTLPPATHTNTFLVGDGPCVLVEPAPIDEQEQALMARWVEQARAAGLSPQAIVPTHHHPDHVGGTALAERLGLPIWAHAQTAERMRAKVDRHLTAGEVLELGSIRLEVSHTPGHAPGHLCFFEPTSRTAIVGDMVAGVGTILVEPGDGDMRLYLESLAALRTLDARKLLPAHGGVIADPAACLDHYVAHREMREQKVLGAVTGAEGSTTLELVPVVYDDAPRQVWPLAALSLQAHLDKLEADGKVRRDGERWALSARPDPKDR